MNGYRVVAISILGLKHRASVEISTAQFTLWLTLQRGNLPWITDSARTAL